MSDGINRIRILLINTGKVLPFVLCISVCVSYCECVFALITNYYIVYGDAMILNKPVSWLLGNWFEYNIPLLIVLTILTIAIRTCIFNKLALLYDYLNLWEKNYFETVELYEETIYVIAIANVIVSGFFVYKGYKLYLKNFKKT